MEERPRWPLWLSPAFGLGVGIYFVLPQEPPGWLGAALFLAIAVICWLLRRRALVFLLVLGLGTTAAGFAAAQLRTTLVAAPILEKSLNARKVEGEVLAIEPRAKGRRMVLRSPRIDGLAPELTPARVRVTLAGDHGAALRPGDLVSLRAVLRPPPSPVSPGAFDFGRRAYFQRLGGFGFALGGVERLPAVPGATAPSVASVASVPTTASVVSVAPGRFQTLSIWWERLRQELAERIRRQLAGDTGAVAVALMIGQRGGISEAVLENMRGSGLAHLLAISGLHMGLVAGWLFLAIRGGLALLPRLALFYPIKKWAAVVAGLGALLYLFIAGAPIPTLRAFIMVATVLAAVVLDRRALSLRLVAWAGVIILLVLPESLVSVSFQLSFAAVVALIAAYESLTLRGRGWTAERSWPVKAAVYIGGVGLTSVIATLATGPFISYHFNRADRLYRSERDRC